MKKLFLFLAATAFAVSMAGQEIGADSIAINPAEPIFAVVDHMPSFPGGRSAMEQFIAQNIIYPQIAKENGISGRVLITFVIEKDGRINNIEVKRSAGDPSLDKEAMRVIRMMPKWEPGSQNGKLVRVGYTVPVQFNL